MRSEDKHYWSEYLPSSAQGNAYCVQPSVHTDVSASLLLKTLRLVQHNDEYLKLCIVNLCSILKHRTSGVRESNYVALRGCCVVQLSLVETSLECLED